MSEMRQENGVTPSPPGRNRYEGCYCWLCEKINKGAGLTAAHVRAALQREGLEHCFNGIEDNPTAPGEVVLWVVMGHPVRSVDEAIEFARQLDREEE